MALTGSSLPDPFVLDDTVPRSFPPGIWMDASGLTRRPAAIDPAKKTLVLISAGQSQMENIAPTTYVPTYGSKLDQLNIYDGQLYNIAGPLLGAAYPSLQAYPHLGYGNITTQLADLFIYYGKFDRVIVVSIAVGGTSIDLWATGSLRNRFPVAMRRLAALGIVPGMAGVTFTCVLGIGEADVGLGTIKADFESRTRQFLANGQAAGYSGRLFVALETSPGDTLSGTYQGQLGVVDNATIFQGGNLNTLTGTTYRGADGTHTNDTGQAAYATRFYNAMVASGAPF